MYNTVFSPDYMYSVSIIHSPAGHPLNMPPDNGWSSPPSIPRTCPNIPKHTQTSTPKHHFLRRPSNHHPPLLSLTPPFVCLYSSTNLFLFLLSLSLSLFLSIRIIVQSLPPSLPFSLFSLSLPFFSFPSLSSFLSFSFSSFPFNFLW